MLIGVVFWDNWVERLIVGLVSAFLLVFGLVLLFLNRRYLLGAHRTSGIIIELKELGDGSASTQYALVEYRIGSDLFQISGIVDAKYHVGEEVPVLYVADDPKKGRIGTLAQLLWFLIAFTGLGAAGIVVVLLV